MAERKKGKPVRMWATVLKVDGEIVSVDANEVRTRAVARVEARIHGGASPRGTGWYASRIEIREVGRG